MILNRSSIAGLVAVVTLTVPAVARAQDGSLTGAWDVSITSPVGVSPAKMALTETDGKLTGILVGETGPTSVEGHRNADGVTLRYSVMHEGAPLPIKMKAAPSAAVLEGPVDFGGLAEGTWKAAKAESTPVDGAWTFSADDGKGSPTTGTLTLIDKDGTVSGRLLVPSRGVDGVVKGTVRDGELKLKADATIDGSPISIDMPATLDADAIKGTFAVADLSGRWTATRP